MDINTKSSLETAVAYQFGKNKVSGLDWYNAPDPRPDYYGIFQATLMLQILATVGENLFQEMKTCVRFTGTKLYEANEAMLKRFTMPME